MLENNYVLIEIISEKIMKTLKGIRTQKPSNAGHVVYKFDVHANKANQS